MRKISIANQKGGCGKTTTAINLSACLAIQGRSVLLIDLDPQGHSTLGLNIDVNDFENTVHDALCYSEGEATTLDDVAIPIDENFNFVPASITLNAFEQEFSGVPNRDLKLKEAIEKLYSSYDYVIIDCPPNLGLLTFNSLMASTEVFIPIDMGFFSLQGTNRLMEIIELVQKKVDHDIKVKAIATMFDKRTRISKEILKHLQDHFKELVFNSVINFNVKLKEAASFGETIVEYDRKAQGFKDYLELTAEVIEDERQSKIIPFIEQKMPAFRPHLIEKKFVYHAPEAKSIRIVGDFDHRAPMAEILMDPNGDGTWSKVINLEPGEYNYQFVVDDRWMEKKKRLLK